MSTDVLKEFLIAIGIKVNTAELSSVDAAVGKTAKSAAKLDASATAASSTLTNKLGPALGALLSPLTLVTAAIGEAYHVMFGFIEKSAAGFDRIAHLADRVNTTADAVKKLGYVAQFTGSSVEAAESSLDGLNRAAGEAFLGIGRAKKVFDAIGLSVKDSNGKLKDTSRLMSELGQKIKPLQRGEQLAILGKLGIDKTLINSLTQDVSGLTSEYDQMYKAAGISVDQASKSAVEFSDSLGKVGAVLGVIKDAIAVSFFDEFREGFDSFRQQLVTNLPKIIDAIKPVLISMVKIGEVVLKIGVIFAGVAGTVISFIQKINDATGGWAVKIGAITLAWNKLNFAFLRSPIGIIIELATAFALLYDDYKTWEKGGKSFINWGNTSGLIIANVIADLSLLTAGIYAYTKGVKLARSAMAAFNIIMDMNPIGLVIAALAALTFAGYELYKNWDVISKKFKDIFGGLADWFKGTWQAVYDWFDNIFGKIVGGIEKVINKTESFAKSINILPGVSIGGGMPLSAKLAPSPATAGAISSNKNVTVNQKTEINVNGSGSPHETAMAVKNAQVQVNGDQFRNMQGAVQ